jgi:hypothetical protein
VHSTQILWHSIKEAKECSWQCRSRENLLVFQTRAAVDETIPFRSSFTSSELKLFSLGRLPGLVFYAGNGRLPFIHFDEASFLLTCRAKRVNQTYAKKFTDVSLNIEIIHIGCSTITTTLVNP